MKYFASKDNFSKFIKKKRITHCFFVEAHIEKIINHLNYIEVIVSYRFEDHCFERKFSFQFNNKISSVSSVSSLLIDCFGDDFSISINNFMNNMTTPLDERLVNKIKDEIKRFFEPDIEASEISIMYSK